MSKIEFFVSGSTEISLPNEGFSKGTQLLKILQGLDFDLTKNPSSKYLLMIDHNESDYRAYIREGGSKENAFLLRLEPKVIFPKQYSDKIESNYRRIFSPGLVASGDRASKIYGCAYQYQANPVIPTIVEHQQHSVYLDMSDDEVLESWLDRDIFISMVAANKVSSQKDDNYGTRRQIARGSSTEILEVYGPYWGDDYFSQIKHRLGVVSFSLRNGILPNLKSLYGNLHWKYPTGKGVVSNKHDVLRKSKFTIAAENSNDYFSEKLFDAIYDGTIPLYIGPNLSDSGLPKNIGINISGGIKEIEEITSFMPNQQILEILTNGRKFLESELFHSNWKEAGVYSRISKEIQKDLYIE
jgi:hypothetical protein